ncbi:hypothetical protein [Streptomyces acidiscabies]|uniref:Uncharacterized protein n=1 Tax=Streptomyces acidiscabies TaxID=42234 RepID=A0A0L0KLX9_9ACTN|nr:hypothetical protein [Streptomyces acidiscabies]KND39232.1 hypothetical protein IQ63_04365 [Streptomyces acidiscabies]
MATPITERITDTPELDLVTHSPDGESRGMLMRVGDVFPLNPIRHILSSTHDQPSEYRPWGLRFLEIPRPSAGAHEGKSSQTSEGSPDGSGPQSEETSDD